MRAYEEVAFAMNEEFGLTTVENIIIGHDRIFGRVR